MVMIDLYTDWIGHVNIGIIFLSSEIPNDAYTTPSQFWLAVQHSVKSTASLLAHIGT